MSRDVHGRDQRPDRLWEQLPVRLPGRDVRLRPERIRGGDADVQPAVHAELSSHAPARRYAVFDGSRIVRAVGRRLRRLDCEHGVHVRDLAAALVHQALARTAT